LLLLFICLIDFRVVNRENDHIFQSLVSDPFHILLPSEKQEQQDTAAIHKSINK